MRGDCREFKRRLFPFLRGRFRGVRGSESDPSLLFSFSSDWPEMRKESFFFYLFILLNIPGKISSAHMRLANQ